MIETVGGRTGFDENAWMNEKRGENVLIVLGMETVQAPDGRVGMQITSDQGRLHGVGTHGIYYRSEMFNGDLLRPWKTFLFAMFPGAVQIAPAQLLERLKGAGPPKGFGR